MTSSTPLVKLLLNHQLRLKTRMKRNQQIDLNLIKKKETISAILDHQEYKVKKGINLQDNQTTRGQMK